MTRWKRELKKSRPNIFLSFVRSNDQYRHEAGYRNDWSMTYFYMLSVARGHASHKPLYEWARDMYRGELPLP